MLYVQWSGKRTWHKLCIQSCLPGASSAPPLPCWVSPSKLDKLGLAGCGKSHENRTRKEQQEQYLRKRVSEGVSE